MQEISTIGIVFFRQLEQLEWNILVCCVFWIVLPNCLGDKRLRCLGGKFLCCVNASAPASTWMVIYAISSTPFQWYVQWDCSVFFSVVMWHWHPLWFGSLIDSPAPFVIMQTPWLAQWSSVVVLNFSYRSEFDALFLCGCHVRLHVVGFIFEWSSCLSLSWLWWPTACFFVITVCLGNSLRGRVCLRVVVSFVVFMVVAFVFAWSRSHLDELVSWLPKPILMLLEGSAAWGWRCSGVALLEGGAAWG